MTSIDRLRDRMVALWTSWSYPTRFAIVLFVFYFLYAFVHQFARYHWYPPAALCLAAFVLLPPRYWLAIAMGEWLHRLVVFNFYWYAVGAYAILTVTTFLQPLPTMLVGAWYRPTFLRDGIRDVGGVGRLLVVIFIATLACVATNSLLLFVDFFNPPIKPLRFMADIALGNGIGFFVVFAPILVLATQSTRILWLIARSLMIWVVPILAIFILLSMSQDSGIPALYSRVIVQLPGIFIAWRHGWAGAVLSFALTSSANRFFHENDQPPHAIDPTAEMTTQLVVFVLGCASYLLGAAVSALRDRQADLEASVIHSNAISQANQTLAREVRDAAERNLQLETAQRREIATALHDEFGQNLTAMTVRLKLTEQYFADPSALEPLRSLIERMRHSVRRLLDSLSPAALDEFGLRRALTDGPVRSMVEDAGLHWQLRFHGDTGSMDKLPEHQQSTIYRIVQEAATNTVRHARATSFMVAMRMSKRHRKNVLFLTLSDDGGGITNIQQERRRYGLQGIRDRVLATSGVLHVRSNERGTRLHVMLRVE